MTHDSFKVDEVDNSSGGIRMRWTMVVVHWPPLLLTIKHWAVVNSVDLSILSRLATP
jgi:hypothetical protein